LPSFRRSCSPALLCLPSLFWLGACASIAPGVTVDTGTALERVFFAMDADATVAVVAAASPTTSARPALAVPAGRVAGGEGLDRGPGESLAGGPAPASEGAAGWPPRDMSPAEFAAPPQGDSDVFGPRKGSSILTVSGDISIDKNETRVSLQGGLGYFLTPEIEVGGQVFVSSGDSSDLFSLNPYGNYNVQVDPRFWVYGGPHLGLGVFNQGGSSDTSAQIGLHGGGRYWIRPRTSLFGELRYTHADTLDLTQILIGFSYVF